MDVTKPYKCIGFGAMDVTKPYKFIGFGAMDVPSWVWYCPLSSQITAECFGYRYYSILRNSASGP